ncbi:5-dehydro-4-deoxy-D-glucuronate isomerase [Sporomusa sp.]|jgi:4-deoxy-L-threo-5-hexosulose-uronate ketol-isomerase|uniref:5-dehydro-4-deoxy-D-glucuronate isomerase n=1 Tax=Sporomusa sp. TaxID=2078658 RepID=UPI002CAB7959|nr:5-dehydro-4-deoxy-D-glucuronate isomerase [Sporomusa sp.]MDF2874455.1 4-deoxy-L-threo-5-hexosulose-uronate ketol-isomerase [Sporomusa sp.]HWR07372.1 5-dehydro-4-deoxy-D-glucuronate isomerase [Sporomusa sp.]
MEVRHSVYPEDVKRLTTEELRERFLIQGLFQPDEIKMVYSHVDRMITGSACPVKPLILAVGKEMGVEYFLERRELGVINVGGAGTVSVDGVDYSLDTTDGLYVGKGSKEIIFSSTDAAKPAKFYFNSAPAHATYPTVRIERQSITPAHLGSIESSNERNIYKYIHPQGVKSCQLVMGMTVLEPGNMWNSMPCHTHDRRMEVYFYFNLPEEAVVFHLMGEPNQTRHIVMRNEEAIISPSWSIHSGVATSCYTFIWGMAGENQTFDDMDHVAMKNIK